VYKILPYTKQKARQINVLVRPSKKKGKKIDVYDNKGNYITSVGAKGYLDYPNYKKLFGKTVADQRRRLYKLRHQADRIVKGSPGYFADQLLW
jgi:spermidine/putrescine-binding protein